MVLSVHRAVSRVYGGTLHRHRESDYITDSQHLGSTKATRPSTFIRIMAGTLSEQPSCHRFFKVLEILQIITYMQLESPQLGGALPDSMIERLEDTGLIILFLESASDDEDCGLLLEPLTHSENPMCCKYLLSCSPYTMWGAALSLDGARVSSVPVTIICI